MKLLPWELSGYCEREVARLYPEAVVSGIADALPMFVNNRAKAEFPETIRNWAIAYIGFQQIDAQQSEAHLIEAAEGRLKSAAAEFLVAYEALGFAGHLRLEQRLDRTVGRDRPFEPPSKETLSFLSALCHGISIVAGAYGDGQKNPRRTRPRKGKRRARRLAVSGLAGIYWIFTGRRATLPRNDYLNKHYGPFRNFCVTALAPIEGEKNVERGLNKVITEVLYTGRSKPRSKTG
jgi:hypothetical protein